MEKEGKDKMFKKTIRIYDICNIHKKYLRFYNIKVISIVALLDDIFPCSHLPLEHCVQHLAHLILECKERIHEGVGWTYHLGFMFARKIVARERKRGHCAEWREGE